MGQLTDKSTDTNAAGGGDNFDAVRVAQAEWERTVRGPALRARPERKKEARTRSGLPVKPLYTPADLDGHDYLATVGFPGQYPFTRGVDPNMYRSQLWTMGQYAGFGSAEDSNRRFKYIVESGGTGFAIALDLPMQTGYDSDHPRAAGEVGKLGVALNTLRDMEILLDGVPLQKVRQIRTSANAIGPIALAMFVCAAEKQGVSPTSFNVLIQNDPLKEYLGRGAYIYPPRPAVRLTADVMDYCARHIPNWTAVNVSGYHIRESGATAIQEVAFAFANAIAYIEETLSRGLSIDAVAPGMWMFFSIEMDVFEEVAKLRAARRLWARLMRERYGATRPEAMQLRFLAFSAGSCFTAQQPLNNVARATAMSLAALLGGVQTLHCSSYDEAIGLPSQEAVTISLRTQQILAEESGIPNVIDPLAGSYYVETLTDQIEQEVVKLLDWVGQIGGAVVGIENGLIQAQISESAYLQQRRQEEKDLVVVGVNEYVAAERQSFVPFSVDTTMQQRIVDRLQQVRQERDEAAVQRALAHLAEQARGTANTVPATMEAIRAYATVGEICDVLRGIFGEYTDRGF